MSKCRQKRQFNMMTICFISFVREQWWWYVQENEFLHFSAHKKNALKRTPCAAECLLMLQEEEEPILIIALASLHFQGRKRKGSILFGSVFPPLFSPLLKLHSLPLLLSPSSLSSSPPAIIRKRTHVRACTSISSIRARAANGVAAHCTAA